MKRRLFNGHVLGSLAMPWLVGCGGPIQNTSKTTTPVTVPAEDLLAETDTLHEVQLTLGEMTTDSPPVNRLVLGSNVQWVDRGDGLLDSSGNWPSDDPKSPLPQALALLPTVLRYPGGVLADVFHWDQASNEHALKVINGTAPAAAQETTLLTTQRYLELCEALGAEPMITVNVATGDAAEAAAWVQAINGGSGLTSSITGERLRSVRFWEIGNEPYLYEEGYPSLYQTPEVYAAKVKGFVQAMKAVDPSIQVGLPLSANERNATPVTAQPTADNPGVDSRNFTARVLDTLAALAAPNIDFVALHCAYLPLAPLSSNDAFDPDLAYNAAMAAAATVENDIAAVKTLISSHYKGSNAATLKFALTEYAPYFVSNYLVGDDGPQDINASAKAWSTSPAGALYVADLMLALANRDDILSANHWSLLGNDHFGAISSDADGDPYTRPIHAVLSLLAEALPASGASLLPTALVSRYMSTPELGLVAANNVRRVRTLFTHIPADADAGTGAQLKVVLINKDPVRGAALKLNVGPWNVPLDGPALSSLSLPPEWRANPADGLDDHASELVRSSQTPSLGSKGLEMTLPPHSVSVLTLPVLNG